MPDIPRDDLDKMIALLTKIDSTTAKLLDTQMAARTETAAKLDLIQQGVNATSERVAGTGDLYAKLNEIQNAVAPVDDVHRDRIALLLMQIRDRLPR